MKLNKLEKNMYTNKKKLNKYIYIFLKNIHY